MSPTDGERLATVEQVLLDLRGDAVDAKQEQARTRERLHALEATVRGLVLANDNEQATTRRRQQRIELRLQVLTIVIAVAAILVPILVVWTHH